MLLVIRRGREGGEKRREEAVQYCPVLDKEMLGKSRSNACFFFAFVGCWIYSIRNDMFLYCTIHIIYSSTCFVCLEYCTVVNCTELYCTTYFTVHSYIIIRHVSI